MPEPFFMLFSFGCVVAQKVKIESVPVVFYEVHGSGNGYVAKIDGSIHVQDNAALFRYLHELLYS